MAKRQGIIKHNSDAVQGEGSWVKIRNLKVGTVRKLQKTATLNRKISKDDTEFDELSFDIGIDTIIDHVVDWNWVDDNDKPLPKPSDDKKVADELTTEELSFIGEILMKNQQRKN